jgi:hypothetical protein
MARSEALQQFLDAAFVAFDHFATDIRSRNSIMQMFSRLEVPGEMQGFAGKRLPVCEHYLEEALENGSKDPALKPLAARFRSLEPDLEWKRRSTYDNTASQNFSMSHANVMIVGPGALERRQDLWLGATLMAPHVRYPDHNHEPEETYLVLSEGEFQQADNGWFSPGVGGSFYNPPNIRHAMRSTEKPLLAFWALLPVRTQQ